MQELEPKFEISPYVKRSQELTVTTPEEAQIAANELVAYKLMKDEIRATFSPLKKSSWDHHKSLIAAESKYLDPLDAAEERVKNKSLAYYEARDEARRIEQSRLESEAQAEAERTRQIDLDAAKAEAARQRAQRDALDAQMTAEREKAAAEAQERAKLEAHRAAAELKRINGLKSVAAADKARQDAARAKEAFERAEAIRCENEHTVAVQRAAEIKRAEQARAEAAALAREIAASEAVAAPVVLPDAPKITGQVAKTTWTYEITDLSLVPDDYITRVADKDMLSAYARKNGPLAKMPGVRFYQQHSLSIYTARGAK